MDAPPVASEQREPATRLRRASSLPDAAAVSVSPWLAIGVGAVLAAAIVLRFLTRSQLWLDEALSVEIARVPLRHLTDALRHDGSPPLYYALLHGWIRLFGTGAFATRALSGVLAVVTLPVAWVAGRRLAGRRVAWAAVLILATSPFAVRYATEARMYALLTLLALVGYLAVDTAVRRPSPASTAAVAVVTALLLYTHYWAGYLVIATAALLARRALGDKDRGARWALVGIAVGCALFLPWVPTFLYQLRHTGTPWANHIRPSAIVVSVDEWAGGGQDTAHFLALLLFGLAALGLFGRAIDGRRVELDLRTRRRARPLAIVCLGTMVAAVVIGLATRAAFVGRYTAVVLPLFVLLVALGVESLTASGVRVGVLAVAVLLGLGGSLPNVGSGRTEAVLVAKKLNALAKPGDVVAYCPDQLGPSLTRLLHPGFVQLSWPNGGSPHRVDWVDYAQRNRRARGADFARTILQAAGDHDVWLVWTPNYRTLKGKCEAVGAALEQALPTKQRVVAVRAGKFEERMGLVKFGR